MIIRAVFLLVITIIQSPRLTAEENTSEWPLRVLSFAYLAHDGFPLIDEFKASNEDHRPLKALIVKKYGALAKIFEEAQTKHNQPLADLAWLGRHCWIRWQPGYVCGDHEDRANQHQGLFYVSDPVSGNRPFLILITSNVSPRMTSIYRLFQDELELIYHFRDDLSSECKIDEPGTALFVTYNAEISNDGKLWLYETEGFHSEVFPRRKFELSVTEERCALKLLDEHIPVSEN